MAKESKTKITLQHSFDFKEKMQFDKALERLTHHLSVVDRIKLDGCIKNGEIIDKFKGCYVYH